MKSARACHASIELREVEDVGGKLGVGNLPLVDVEHPSDFLLAQCRERHGQRSEAQRIAAEKEQRKFVTFRARAVIAEFLDAEVPTQCSER